MQVNEEGNISIIDTKEECKTTLFQNKKRNELSLQDFLFLFQQDFFKCNYNWKKTITFSVLCVEEDTKSRPLYADSHDEENCKQNRKEQ